MGRKKKGASVKKSRSSQLVHQEELYKKSPHSFVFNRGHVGKNVKQLITDVRRVMEPYTATNLKPRRKNVLKDFVNIAGVLNVSHFMIFTKTEVNTNLKVCRLPKGPTLTFKVHNYCLSRDIISSLRKPNLEQKQFQEHPLLVMNNFSAQEMQMKLLSSMFQNMFPSINVNTVNLNSIRRTVMMNYDPETKMIDFRHYNIKVVPVGMSRGVKKLIKADVPDMSRFGDISEYIAQGGNISESEAELDGPEGEVVLPQHIGSRGNIKAAKSAIRITELGPRMTLQLVKVEEGLCTGQVMFHEFIHKSPGEIQSTQAMREKKRKLKEMRKQQQQANLTKKEQAKEAHKQKSLEGMKKKMESKDAEEVDEDTVQKDDSGTDDEEYFKQEVGEAPDPGMFPSKGVKRKMTGNTNRPTNAKQRRKEVTEHKPEKRNKFSVKRQNLKSSFEKKGTKVFKNKSKLNSGLKKKDQKRVSGNNKGGKHQRENKKGKHKRK